MILTTATDILGHLERGDLAKDFAGSVHKVLAALQEQDDGTGAVTLRLSFVVKGDMVAIKADLAEQLPKRKRKSSSAFLTRDGRLSLQHPEQIDIDDVLHRPSRAGAVDAITR